MQSIEKAAGAFAYPGRGLFVGLAPEGDRALLGYFIMGRSANSRNRVLVLLEDGSVRSKACDERLVEDPSLILYTPVRALGTRTIVSNGDQTDTVYAALEAGESFEAALLARTYEPDAPHYTPRISAILDSAGGQLLYRMSILRRRAGGAAERAFFEYPAAVVGEGHFLHTYNHDADPLPPFQGGPRRVAIAGSLEELTDALWNALHPENRVALFVREIDLKSGDTRSLIRNQKEAICES